MIHVMEVSASSMPFDFESDGNINPGGIYILLALELISDSYSPKN